MPGVNPPRVPDGLRDLMKSLTKEMLREKPPNIYEFSAQYFESLLEEKKDFGFRGYEPVTSYENILKNRERNQVPLSLVYAIVPESLTELLKEFIKAVLRANPTNICEFAVHYFRHLQKAKEQMDSGYAVQYTAYESYFKSKERFSFTPYVRCTCGRTFGEGVVIQGQHEEATLITSKTQITSQQSEHICQPADIDKIKTEVIADHNNTVDSRSSTGSVHSPEIKSNLKASYDDEKYVKSIYILQRFFRRCLLKRQNGKVRVVESQILSQKGQAIMSKEAAALIIKRTIQKLFNEKQFKNRKTAKKLVESNVGVPHFQGDEIADNDSEAASYTSASTALMSADSVTESGEVSQRNYDDAIPRKTLLEHNLVEIEGVSDEIEQSREAVIKPTKVDSNEAVPNKDNSDEKSIDLFIQEDPNEINKSQFTGTNKTISASEQKHEPFNTNMETLQKEQRIKDKMESTEENISGESNKMILKETPAQLTETILSKSNVLTSKALKANANSSTDAKTEDLDSGSEQTNVIEVTKVKPLKSISENPEAEAEQTKSSEKQQTNMEDETSNEPKTQLNKATVSDLTGMEVKSVSKNSATGKIENDQIEKNTESVEEVKTQIEKVESKIPVNTKIVESENATTKDNLNDTVAEEIEKNKVTGLGQNTMQIETADIHKLGEEKIDKTEPTNMEIETKVASKQDKDEENSEEETNEFLKHEEESKQPNSEIEPSSRLEKPTDHKQVEVDKVTSPEKKIKEVTGKKDISEDEITQSKEPNSRDQPNQITTIGGDNEDDSIGSTKSNEEITDSMQANKELKSDDKKNNESLEENNIQQKKAQTETFEESTIAEVDHLKKSEQTLIQRAAPKTEEKAETVQKETKENVNKDHENDAIQENTINQDTENETIGLKESVIQKGILNGTVTICEANILLADETKSSTDEDIEMERNDKLKTSQSNDKLAVEAEESGKLEAAVDNVNEIITADVSEAAIMKRTSSLQSTSNLLNETKLVTEETDNENNSDKDDINATTATRPKRELKEVTPKDGDNQVTENGNENAVKEGKMDSAEKQLSAMNEPESDSNNDVKRNSLDEKKSIENKTIEDEENASTSVEKPSSGALKSAPVSTENPIDKTEKHADLTTKLVENIDKVGKSSQEEVQKDVLRSLPESTNASNESSSPNENVVSLPTKTPNNVTPVKVVSTEITHTAEVLESSTESQKIGSMESERTTSEADVGSVTKVRSAENENTAKEQDLASESQIVPSQSTEKLDAKTEANLTDDKPKLDDNIETDSSDVNTKTAVAGYALAENQNNGNDKHLSDNSKITKDVLHSTDLNQISSEQIINTDTAATNNESKEIPLDRTYDVIAIGDKKDSDISAAVDGESILSKEDTKSDATDESVMKNESERENKSSEELSEKTSEKPSGKTSEKPNEEASEKTSEKANEKASEKTSEKANEKNKNADDESILSSNDGMKNESEREKKLSEELSEKTSGKPSEKASEKPTEEAIEKTSEKTIEKASEKANENADDESILSSIDGMKNESERKKKSSEELNEKTSEKPSEKTSENPNEAASEKTSEKAIEKVSEKASEKTSEKKSEKDIPNSDEQDKKSTSSSDENKSEINAAEDIAANQQQAADMKQVETKGNSKDNVTNETAPHAIEEIPADLESPSQDDHILTTKISNEAKDNEVSSVTKNAKISTESNTDNVSHISNDSAEEKVRAEKESSILTSTELSSDNKTVDEKIKTISASKNNDANEKLKTEMSAASLETKAKENINKTVDVSDEKSKSDLKDKDQLQNSKSDVESKIVPTNIHSLSSENGNTNDEPNSTTLNDENHSKEEKALDVETDIVTQLDKQIVPNKTSEKSKDEDHPSEPTDKATNIVEVPKNSSPDNNVNIDIGKLTTDTTIGTQNSHKSSIGIGIDSTSKKSKHSNLHPSNKTQKPANKESNNKLLNNSSDPYVEATRPPIAEIYLKSFKAANDLPWYDTSGVEGWNVESPSEKASVRGVEKPLSKLRYSQESSDTEYSDSLNESPYERDSLEQSSSKTMERDSLEASSAKTTDIDEDSLELEQNETTLNTAAAKPFEEKERTPTYLYGIDKNGQTTQGRKVYKSPTAFVIPFDNGNKKSIKSKENNNDISDMKDVDAEMSPEGTEQEAVKTPKEKVTLSLDLQKDDNIETDSELDLETPTKLFAELNAFDDIANDTATQKYALDVTYTAEEAALLSANIDLGEDILDENKENLEDTILPSSASMLHTILELNEAETPRNDLSKEPAQDPTESGSENDSDPTTSSWTCSKEFDEPILSDEYMNEKESFDEPNLRNRRAITADTGEAGDTQGGIYEVDPNSEIAHTLENEKDARTSEVTQLQQSIIELDQRLIEESVAQDATIKPDIEFIAETIADLKSSTMQLSEFDMLISKAPTPPAEDPKHSEDETNHEDLTAVTDMDKTIERINSKDSGEVMLKSYSLDSTTEIKTDEKALHEEDKEVIVKNLNLDNLYALERAATFIQKVYRGYLTRNRVKRGDYAQVQLATSPTKATLQKDISELEILAEKEALIEDIKKQVIESETQAEKSSENPDQTIDSTKESLQKDISELEILTEKAALIEEIKKQVIESEIQAEKNSDNPNQTIDPKRDEENVTHSVIKEAAAPLETTEDTLIVAEQNGEQKVVMDEQTKIDEAITNLENMALNIIKIDTIEKKSDLKHHANVVKIITDFLNIEREFHTSQHANPPGLTKANDTKEAATHLITETSKDGHETEPATVENIKNLTPEEQKNTIGNVIKNVAGLQAEKNLTNLEVSSELLKADEQLENENEIKNKTSNNSEIKSHETELRPSIEHSDIIQESSIQENAKALHNEDEQLEKTTQIKNETIETPEIKSHIEDHSDINQEPSNTKEVKEELESDGKNLITEALTDKVPEKQDSETTRNIQNLDDTTEPKKGTSGYLQKGIEASNDEEDNILRGKTDISSSSNKENTIYNKFSEGKDINSIEEATKSEKPKTVLKEDAIKSNKDEQIKDDNKTEDDMEEPAVSNKAIEDTIKELTKAADISDGIESKLEEQEYDDHDKVIKDEEGESLPRDEKIVYTKKEIAAPTDINKDTTLTQEDTSKNLKDPAFEETKNKDTETVMPAEPASLDIETKLLEENVDKLLLQAQRVVTFLEETADTSQGKEEERTENSKLEVTKTDIDKDAEAVQKSTAALNVGKKMTNEPALGKKESSSQLETEQDIVQELSKSKEEDSTEERKLTKKETSIEKDRVGDANEDASHMVNEMADESVLKNKESTSHLKTDQNIAQEPTQSEKEGSAEETNLVIKEANIKKVHIGDVEEVNKTETVSNMVNEVTEKEKLGKKESTSNLENDQVIIQGKNKSTSNLEKDMDLVQEPLIQARKFGETSLGAPTNTARATSGNMTNDNIAEGQVPDEKLKVEEAAKVSNQSNKEDAENTTNSSVTEKAAKDVDVKTNQTNQPTIDSSSLEQAENSENEISPKQTKVDGEPKAKIVEKQHPVKEDPHTFSDERKALAATVIQNAYRNYLEHKQNKSDRKMSNTNSWDNSQSTEIYVGNDGMNSRSGDDSKSLASLEMTTELNGAENLEHSINPEPSAPYEHELHEDHESQQKVNWFVGTEPIVSSKKLDDELELNLVTEPADTVEADDACGRDLSKISFVTPLSSEATVLVDSTDNKSLEISNDTFTNDNSLRAINNSVEIVSAVDNDSKGETAAAHLNIEKADEPETSEAVAVKVEETGEAAVDKGVEAAAVVDDKQASDNGNSVARIVRAKDGIEVNETADLNDTTKSVNLNKFVGEFIESERHFNEFKRNNGPTNNPHEESKGPQEVDKDENAMVINERQNSLLAKTKNDTTEDNIGNTEDGNIKDGNSFDSTKLEIIESTDENQDNGSKEHQVEPKLRIKQDTFDKDSAERADSIDYALIQNFLDGEREYWDSDLPYEKLEESCIKKSLSLTYLPDAEENETTSEPGNIATKTDSSDTDDADASADTNDTLNTMTEKLRETEQVIERMHSRRASETKIGSNEEKLAKEPSFEEPVIRTMHQLQESLVGSPELEDDAVIVMNRLQREDTRESSAQSDSVVFGSDDISQDERAEAEEFEESPLVKASLHRLYTIAGEDPKVLFKSVTIDETIRYIEPPDVETTATSGSSFCLDDDTSENIRQKMMAYSLSEADSDYYELASSGSVMRGVSCDQPKVNPDDFNISTALIDAGTSTDTESTIVSAATKIQAGARGYLTRKRLRRASGGTKSSVQERGSKASFGNEAIGESLENMIEDESAKKIQQAYRQYRRRSKKVGVHQSASGKSGSHATLNSENSLAARRMTLHRHDALRNDSTPDEESGSNGDNGKSKVENKRSAATAKKEVIKATVVQSSTTSAAATIERKKKIVDSKLKWIAMRQNSMPVQIDCEVFRVIPKHMRKRIKSAEEEKKVRRRIFKD